MKNSIGFVGLFLSLNAFSMPADLQGYLRTGVGHNLSSQKQKCFNNPGTEGNEFRLGNECGVYGETTFSLNFDEKMNRSSNFRLQTTFAYSPNGNTQYGDESSQNDIDIIEVFIEARNVEGIPYTYWVGKRFYRDENIHMNDFYYFASMNGVGAGVKDIPLFDALFSMAYIQETMTSPNSSNQLVKSFLDFRLFGIKVQKIGELNFWSSIGYAPGGNVGNIKYEKVTGDAFGVRLRNHLTDGTNDFTLIYGKNLMTSLSVSGDGEVKEGTDNHKRYKIRAVEYLTKKISDELESNFVITIEQRNLGRSDSTWWDIGLRTVYFIKDHLHLLTEFGHSEVLSSQNRRTLSRFTFAYEIALYRSILARPVIRLFATETIWNKENRENFEGKREGHAIGVQGEVWF